MTHTLEGWGVLVTRPTGRHLGLCEGIHAAGGHPVHLPGVEIEALARARPQEALGHLTVDDWAIFVSTAAVQHTGAALASIPEGVRLAAVGETTADALIEAGCRGVLTPAHGGSEALLSVLPRAAVENQQILIVRGEGGRERLARGLEETGAQVSYLEVYRRHRPAVAPAGALSALDADAVHALTVSSGEILDNVLHLLGKERRKKVLGLPLVVPSERVAERARAAGFSGLVASTSPSDDAVVDTLLELRDKIGQ